MCQRMSDIGRDNKKGPVYGALNLQLSVPQKTGDSLLPVFRQCPGYLLPSGLSRIYLRPCFNFTFPVELGWS